MRILNRNKQTIYYALFQSKTENLDEYGNKTGSFAINYYPVVRSEMNVSAARGTSELEQFGINTLYTRTLVTDDMKCPIAETSVLWVGYDKIDDYDATETPAENDIRIKDGVIVKYDGAEWQTVPYNHVVVGIAKSLNSITYAIKEVEVG